MGHGMRAGQVSGGIDGLQTGEGWEQFDSGGGMESLRLDSRPESGDGFHCLLTTISGADIPELMSEACLLAVYEAGGAFAVEPSMSYFGTAQACLAEGSALVAMIRELQEGEAPLGDEAVKARLGEILPGRGWRSMSDEDVARSEAALRVSRPSLRTAASEGDPWVADQQARLQTYAKGWDSWHTGGGCMALALHDSESRDGFHCLVTDDGGMEIPEHAEAPSLLGVYDPDGQVVFEPEKFFHGGAAACLQEGMAVIQAIRDLRAVRPDATPDDVRLHLEGFLPQRGWREMDLVARVLEPAFRHPVLGSVGISEDEKDTQFWVLSPAGAVLYEVTDQLDPEMKAQQLTAWRERPGANPGGGA